MPNTGGSPKTGESRRLRRRLLLAVALAALVSAVATILIAAVLLDIFEKKQEARNPFFRVVEITDDLDDPAVWGKNFPIHYDSYRKTVDQVRTRFGGSEALPRAATAEDPRTVVSNSRLEEDPRLRTMWAGYAFAEDFREERGHAYMLEDQIFTTRQRVAKQPGTCLNCHASTYLAYKKLGEGDLVKGFELLNPLPYAEARKLVRHPVACIDCHDPQTLHLRITRPAFMAGIRAARAAQGVSGYDVNTMATRQEMRAFVCAQCHVEYYFQGPEKRLVYPWEDGTAAEQILAYYDRVGHRDWIHAETGARVLKAQHPEFELWSQGIHARSGVSCADCHMPYMRVGMLKVSDHHVRSPLLNVSNACRTCHPVAEEELKARAEQIQAKTQEMRNVTMNALMELIGALKQARETGAGDADLELARDCQRKAQFLLDFVEAENSSGFHAPQEAARNLLRSLEYIRKGQQALPVNPAGGGPESRQDTT